MLVEGNERDDIDVCPLENTCVFFLFFLKIERRREDHANTVIGALPITMTHHYDEWCRKSGTTTEKGRWPNCSDDADILHKPCRGALPSLPT